MKSNLRILFLIICLVSFQDADAQLFKRLKKRAKEKAKNIENKVINKVDEEVDKTIDGAIEGRGDRNQGKPTPTTNNTKADTAKKDFGDISINHAQKYGNVAITEVSQVKVGKTDTGYTISGNWWSHQADIYDGFYITIKTDQDLKGNTNATKRTFKIPEEASMQLGYDPQLPYNKKSEDNKVRAVTDDYQNYDVLKGEVTLTVLSDEKIQVSFSGNASLRTVIRKANSDDFSESFYETSISGTIDGDSPKYTSEETVTQTQETQNTSNSGYSITPTTGNTPTPGIYQFSYETVNKITAPKQNRTYIMSYLINPKADYVAMKVDMSDYSEAEMTGESIIVTDKGNVHIFVESAGMKLRMSNGMMGGQKIENPTDQMANHDYGKFNKTGNTKTILGATCHEYNLSDSNTKVSIWVAPSIKLPNWFVKNNSIINGLIMEYTVESSEGKMKSEIIEIKENISKTINPKEYRKMF
ncbi:MAG: hypothetical protein AAF611_23055 [Bacteroidota bacterium]